MKRSMFLIACLGLLCVGSSAKGQETKKSEGKTEVVTDVTAVSAVADTGMNAESKGKYVPVLKYDPTRNAALDIKSAVAEANRTNKRVLVEVGGLWCIWCTRMDEFFDKHPDLLALRETHYVMVKVNFSDENKNVAVLSQYPKVAGYPHIFILGTDGAFLHSQDTGDLEEVKSYNLDKFTEFLKIWVDAPSDTKPSQKAGN